VVLPPGGNGTMSRIGRVGYVGWASAVMDQASSNNAAHGACNAEQSALTIPSLRPAKFIERQDYLLRDG